MSAEMIVTFPREVGATRLDMIVPNSPEEGCWTIGSEKFPTKADAARYWKDKPSPDTLKVSISPRLLANHRETMKGPSRH